MQMYVVQLKLIVKSLCIRIRTLQLQLAKITKIT